MCTHLKITGHSDGNRKHQQQIANEKYPLPHDVIEEMENSKTEGETIAAFVITAVRGEIARRRAEGSGENHGFFARCTGAGGKIGVKAAEEIGQLVTVAREELQRRKAKEQE